MNYFLVFIGGGLGSLARYGLTRLLGTYSLNFPWSTFLANAIACFILGLLMGFQIRGNMDDQSKLLLMIGFCGGFSTFSTFTAEFFKMLQQGNLFTASIYILSSLIICWLFILLGMKIVQ